MSSEAKEKSAEPDLSPIEGDADLQNVFLNPRELTYAVQVVTKSRLLGTLRATIPTGSTVPADQHEQLGRFLKRSNEVIQRLEREVTAAFRGRDWRDVARLVHQNIVQAQCDVREAYERIAERRNGSTHPAIEAAAKAFAAPLDLVDLTDTRPLEIEAAFGDASRLKFEPDQFVTIEKEPTPVITVTFEEPPKRDLWEEARAAVESEMEPVPEFRWSWTDEELFAEHKMHAVYYCVYDLASIWEETEANLIAGFQEWKKACLQSDLKFQRWGFGSQQKTLPDVLKNLESSFERQITTLFKQRLVDQQLGVNYYKVFINPSIDTIITSLRSFSEFENSPDPTYIDTALKDFFTKTRRLVIARSPRIRPEFIQEDDKERALVICKKNEKEPIDRGVVMNCLRAWSTEPEAKLKRQITKGYLKKVLACAIQESNMHAGRVTQHDAWEIAEAIEAHLLPEFNDIAIAQDCSDPLEFVQFCQNILSRALRRIDCFHSTQFPPRLVATAKNAASMTVSWGVRSMALQTPLAHNWSNADADYDTALANFYPTSPETTTKHEEKSDPKIDPRILERWWTSFNESAAKQLHVEVTGVKPAEEGPIRAQVRDVMFGRLKAIVVPKVLKNQEDIDRFVADVRKVVGQMPKSVEVRGCAVAIPDSMSQRLLAELDTLKTKSGAVVALEKQESIEAQILPEFRWSWTDEELFAKDKLISGKIGHLSNTALIEAWDDVADGILSSLKKWAEEECGHNLGEKMGLVQQSEQMRVPSQRKIADAVIQHLEAVTLPCMGAHIQRMLDLHVVQSRIENSRDSFVRWLQKDILSYLEDFPSEQFEKPVNDFFARLNEGDPIRSPISDRPFWITDKEFMVFTKEDTCLKIRRDALVMCLMGGKAIEVSTGKRGKKHYYLQRRLCFTEPQLKFTAEVPNLEERVLEAVGREDGPAQQIAEALCKRIRGVVGGVRDETFSDAASFVRSLKQTGANLLSAIDSLQDSEFDAHLLIAIKNAASYQLCRDIRALAYSAYEHPAIPKDDEYLSEMASFFDNSIKGARAQILDDDPELIAQKTDVLGTGESPSSGIQESEVLSGKMLTRSKILDELIETFRIARRQKRRPKNAATFEAQNFEDSLTNIIADLMPEEIDRPIKLVMLEAWLCGYVKGTLQVVPEKNFDPSFVLKFRGRLHIKLGQKLDQFCHIVTDNHPWSLYFLRQPLDGFGIAKDYDLHSQSFGLDREAIYSELCRKIEAAKADLSVIIRSPGDDRAAKHMEAHPFVLQEKLKQFLDQHGRPKFLSRCDLFAILGFLQASDSYCGIWAEVSGGTAYWNQLNLEEYAKSLFLPLYEVLDQRLADASQVEKDIAASLKREEPSPSAIQAYQSSGDQPAPTMAPPFEASTASVPLVTEPSRSRSLRHQAAIDEVAQRGDIVIQRLILEGRRYGSMVSQLSKLVPVAKEKAEQILEAQELLRMAREALQRLLSEQNGTESNS
jgi:hypothetical protein